MQLVRQYVQQYFGVRIGTQMAAVIANQKLGQLIVIGQISVVSKTDTIGRIDVERLRLTRPGSSCGRIANVANTDVALETHHVPASKYVPHETIALALFQSVFVTPRHDAGGILTAVLHDRQRTV
jgi:hypothetical protein